MAIRIAKLASHNFMKPNTRTTFFFSRPISNNFTTRHPDDDFKRCDQEYQQWCNGGGMFHKSARIDPTARIEIGALVLSFIQNLLWAQCLHWVRKHCVKGLKPGPIGFKLIFLILFFKVETRGLFPHFVFNFRIF
ncbi:hypothetical protein ACP275_13G147200 [Erythranthe tilingii]